MRISVWFCRKINLNKEATYRSKRERERGREGEREREGGRERGKEELVVKNYLH